MQSQKFSLYVDDILLASNDISLLHETKRFLTKNFEMKDLGDASFVLGIQIHRDRSRGTLGLSQTSYIEKVLKRYGMHDSRVCEYLDLTYYAFNNSATLMKFKKVTANTN